MKNIFKLNCILFLFTVSNFDALSQQQFGIKASGGISRITDSKKSSVATFTTPFVPSGQVGFYSNLSLGNTSSLGAELLFSQIEGKDMLEYDLMDPEGNNVGHITSSGWRHISYLSLPVYYGVSINKFTLHAGFQFSYALASSGREKSDGTINEGQEKSYSYNRKTDDINIKNWDYGPRVGIVYPLTNRMAVEATYYYGIHNISYGNFWELKVQQLTVGIMYALWSKSKS